MALRQRRQFERFGLPEFVGLLVVGIALAAASAYWLREVQPEFREAQGRVVEGDVSWIDYNSTDRRQKVTLTYQYTVGTTSYTGSWTGLWPETGNPNALPPDRVDALRTKDYPLVVFLDPDNPAHSSLHVVADEMTHVYAGVVVGLCAAALIYCGGIYPMWKART